MVIFVFTNPEALVAIREKDGHSQLSLSKVSGVSQTGISRLEAGAVPIRPSTAKRLADALGVPISAFTQPTQFSAPGASPPAPGADPIPTAGVAPVRPHAASAVGVTQAGAS